MAVWLYEDILFPVHEIEFEIHEDCPASVYRDIEEAANVLQKSPRSAAALARLCVQKLCTELGLDGSNLNSDIGELVRRGLDQRVQRALDIVRVVGNNAVHPGQIDLRDDRDTALTILQLVNAIIDATISQPMLVNDLYDNLLPESVRAQIAKRDAPAELPADVGSTQPTDEVVEG